MTKEQIDQMVNAFLCWKIPQTFNPDCYISFAPKSDFRGNPPTWPVGTNLFSYTEAKAMVEHMVAALTPQPCADAVALAGRFQKAAIEYGGSETPDEQERTLTALSEASAAVLAAMRPIPEGYVAVPKRALDALYMRLWKRHEHLDDGLPDFEPVRQSWTAEDDAALKAIARYLFAAAPEAPR